MGRLAGEKKHKADGFTNRTDHFPKAVVQWREWSSVEWQVASGKLGGLVAV